MPKAPTEEATPENVQAYKTHSDDNNFATYDACNMSHKLQKLLYRGMMVKGSSVSAHVLKTIDYIDKLNQLSFTMDYKLSVDLVIQFIPNNFLQFIANFNMNKIQCTLLELLNMLKTVEPKGMENFWPLIPLRKERGNSKGPFRKDPRLRKWEPPVPKDTPAPRKSGRVIYFPLRYDLMITSNVLLIKKDDSKKWQEAKESEMNSMY
ncbi:Uncharacterized protein Adt_02812 [Abeliophyllum distichum]|uniref:Uncharacterized protein n=1 Tax=Abeliophyllum distichum TaxID=126358 RepID=A0ABD1VWR6_9LAMI